MSILTPYSNFHLVARNTIVGELKSGLFTPGTIAGMLGIKGGANSYSPDDSMIIGRNTTKLQRKAMKGTNQAVISFMNTLTDDSAWVGYAGNDVQFATTPSLENNATAQVSWGELRTGISIDNQIIANAMRNGGDNAASFLLDPIRTATKEALSRHVQTLSGALVNGLPGSFTADVWGTGATPGVLGILHWINDRNNICNVNRALAAGAGFRAQYSDAALTPSLSLIDQIIVAGVPNGLTAGNELPLPAGISYGDAMGTATGGADGLHTSPLNSKGSKADIAICSPDVYAVLKEEAQARGHLVTSANTKQETTYIGFTAEYFYYNRTCIALDYLLPANTLMVLDSSSFVLHVDEAMEVLPFVDLTKAMPSTAQNNRTTSTLKSRVRFYCDAPWKNFLADNVG